MKNEGGKEMNKPKITIERTDNMLDIAIKVRSVLKHKMSDDEITRIISPLFSSDYLGKRLKSIEEHVNIELNL